jgi:hypothetical protein
MRLENRPGGYAFVRGIAPYSGGAAALPGFALEHVRFRQPVPLRDGFARVKAHLEAHQRPLPALCGMELRSPKPFSFAGFQEFNAGYIDILREWGILLENGLNPVARTNVAPEIGAPAEPALYGFSYTTPSAAATGGFVIAGAGELPEGSLKPEDVVRHGETSTDALREKTRFVMALMQGRLQELGATWDQVNVTEVYTVHSICAFLAQQIIRPMRAAAAHGVTWHYARPPIVSIEYEMDVRNCPRELIL